MKRCSPKVPVIWFPSASEKLAGYYRSRDQLVVVNGDQTIERVARDVDRTVGVRVVA